MNRRKTKQTGMAFLLAALLAVCGLFPPELQLYAKENVVLSDEESAEEELSSSMEEEVKPAEEASESAPEEEGAEESAGGGQVGDASLIFYESVETEELMSVSPFAQSEADLPTGVTREMCSPEYWYNRGYSGIGSDEELMTIEEISALNAATLQEKEASMHDLSAAFDGTYSANALRENLAKAAKPPARIVYVNGELVDKAAYYQEISDAILKTGYTDTEKAYKYAVVVKRTTINNIPVDAYIGYDKPEDPDNENVNSALNVNEPFVIAQRALVEEKEYYWGYSENCVGWVSAADLALCADKEEWLEAWQVEPGEKDFIVITTNQITLEPSYYLPELSEVKLTFGTILKNVPEDKYPQSIGERGPWYNYVVYLPLRDQEGKYYRKEALISRHYEVSTGFLKLTQEELLRIAFNHLGDRYGWGGMLDSMDCSLYVRNIYRCFGVNLPRNTTWQQHVPGRKIDLSGFSDEDKREAIGKLPAGSLLFFPGHVMLYTGMAETEEGEESFVISDTGRLADSAEGAGVRSMYSIILNPLSVKRANGTTWLHNVAAAVLPVSEARFQYLQRNIERVKVPLGEGQSYASSEDTLPLETFLGSTQNMYISFYQVDSSGAVSLEATVVKGSVITTKAPVSQVICDKQTASVKYNKANGLASLTLKKSGEVTFNMQDGSTRVVSFFVENPKAQNAAIKKLLGDTSPGGRISLGVEELLGTRLDGGNLSILSQKKDSAVLEGKRLVLTKPATGSDTVKLRYTYLNKTWNMTITVK